MESLLRTVILDNRIGDYLVCLPPILLVILFKGFLSRSITLLFFRLVKRTSWNIDEKAFLNLLIGPIHAIILLLVTLIALENLHYPSAFNFRLYHVPFRHILDSMSKGLLVICFTWLLLRCIDCAALI